MYQKEKKTRTIVKNIMMSFPLSLRALPSSSTLFEEMNLPILSIQDVFTIFHAISFLRKESIAIQRVPERDGVRYTCPGDDADTEFQEEKADVVSVR